jgi:hypothetical protein
MASKGLVYLLCFAHSPYKHARHYLGATGMALEDRVAAHRGETLHEGDKSYGRSAKLITALLQAGGDFVVADVWETDTRAEAFELERRLKKQGSRARLCSICNPGNTRGTGTGNWPRQRPEEGGESEGSPPPTPDTTSKIPTKQG